MKKILFVLMLVFGISAAARETIKIVVPYSPGGTSDLFARSLAPLLSNSDYNFIVENRVGAGGLIGAEYVAAEKTEPLMLLTGQALVSNVVLGNAKYSLEKDFKHISCITTVPVGVLVNANGPIKKFQDLKEFGKAKPIGYGTSGPGTVQSMMSPVIVAASGTSNQIEIPFKGSADMLNALLSNTIIWVSDNVLLSGSLIDSGRLKLIAVSSKLKKYPEVPTFEELNINVHGFAVKQLFVANTAVSSNLKAHVDAVLNSESVTKMYQTLSYNSCINTSQPDYLITERNIISRLIKH